MNKLTHYQNTSLTRFRLKPLLMAIPISILAACANTPENEFTVNSGPDLVNTDPVVESSLKENSINATSDISDSTNETSGTINETSGTTEGNTPMTVLVIENPEILAKLASNQQLLQEDSIRPNKRVFHFGFNQASLSEEDIELVEKHADYLKANPELKVTIHGHTDTQGNSDYNIVLSEKRASMLVTQLKKFGINKNRIKTIGWGGNYPLVNSLNFSENRRIEIEYSVTHYAANH